ncbi:hypothetical protein [Poriferisphaera sp. WC338]|uniref:hypothetical protein n=1 Tax=Poriferisphaera sp. WC338 TaxID=3425129 RepID=UPI003D81AA0E
MYSFKCSFIITLTLSLFTITTATHAAPIIYGETTKLLLDNNISADLVIFHPVTITTPTFITHIGSTHSDPVSTNAVYGLYTNSFGSPDDLVVASPVTPLKAAGNLIPVTPTVVGAGTHWIAVLYDTDTLITTNSLPDAPQLRFITQPFAAGLPNTVSGDDSAGFFNMSLYIVTDTEALVPEPASFMLLSLISLPLLQRQRHKHSTSHS